MDSPVRDEPDTNGNFSEYYMSENNFDNKFASLSPIYNDIARLFCRVDALEKDVLKLKQLDISHSSTEESNVVASTREINDDSIYQNTYDITYTSDPPNSVQNDEGKSNHFVHSNAIDSTIQESSILTERSLKEESNETNNSVKVANKSDYIDNHRDVFQNEIDILDKINEGNKVPNTSNAFPPPFDGASSDFDRRRMETINESPKRDIQMNEGINQGQNLELGIIGKHTATERSYPKMNENTENTEIIEPSNENMLEQSTLLQEKRDKLDYSIDMGSKLSSMVSEGKYPPDTISKVLPQDFATLLGEKSKINNELCESAVENDSGRNENVSDIAASRSSSDDRNISNVLDLPHLYKSTNGEQSQNVSDSEQERKADDKKVSAPEHVLETDIDCMLKSRDEIVSNIVYSDSTCTNKMDTLEYVNSKNKIESLSESEYSLRPVTPQNRASPLDYDKLNSPSGEVKQEIDSVKYHVKQHPQEISESNLPISNSIANSPVSTNYSVGPSETTSDLIDTSVKHDSDMSDRYNIPSVEKKEPILSAAQRIDQICNSYALKKEKFLPLKTMPITKPGTVEKYSSFVPPTSTFSNEGSLTAKYLHKDASNTELESNDSIDKYSMFRLEEKDKQNRLERKHLEIQQIALDQSDQSNKSYVIQNVNKSDEVLKSSNTFQPPFEGTTSDFNQRRMETINEGPRPNIQMKDPFEGATPDFDRRRMETINEGPRPNIQIQDPFERATSDFDRRRMETINEGPRPNIQMKDPFEGVTSDFDRRRMETMNEGPRLNIPMKDPFEGATSDFDRRRMETINEGPRPNIQMNEGFNQHQNFKLGIISENTVTDRPYPKMQEHTNDNVNKTFFPPDVNHNFEIKFPQKPFQSTLEEETPDWKRRKVDIMNEKYNINGQRDEGFKSWGYQHPLGSNPFIPQPPHPYFPQPEIRLNPCPICQREFQGKLAMSERATHMLFHFRERLYQNVRESDGPIKCLVSNCTFFANSRNRLEFHLRTQHNMVEQFEKEYIQQKKLEEIKNNVRHKLDALKALTESMKKSDQA